MNTHRVFAAIALCMTSACSLAQAGDTTDAGLVAEQLVVAGCSASEVAGMLTRLRSDEGVAALATVRTNRAALEDAQEQQLLTRLAFEADPGNADLEDARDNASTAFDAAVTAVENAEGALHAVLFSGMPAARLVDWQGIRDASEAARAPTPYLVATEDFELLVRALKDEARANRSGEEADQALSSFLSAIRSSYDYVQTQSRLASSLTPVQTMLESAE